MAASCWRGWKIKCPLRLSSHAHTEKHILIWYEAFRDVRTEFSSCHLRVQGEGMKATLSHKMVNVLAHRHGATLECFEDMYLRKRWREFNVSFIQPFREIFSGSAELIICGWHLSHYTFAIVNKTRLRVYCLELLSSKG